MQKKGQENGEIKREKGGKMEVNLQKIFWISDVGFFEKSCGEWKGRKREKEIRNL